MTRAMLAGPAPACGSPGAGLRRPLGTWTAGTGPTARVFVFKVAGETFSGMVCGPCDDLDSVFRSSVWRQPRAFFVRYDGGGPRFRQDGQYRDQVEATLATNQLTMQARREGEPDAFVTTTVARRRRRLRASCAPGLRDFASRVHGFGSVFQRRPLDVGREERAAELVALLARSHCLGICLTG